jgi:osmoprotectant transport system ATP-binding protein
MIKLKNITKIYPGMERPAVKNLNLHIKKGEICVFVGPSGCGKTTTLKMINRLIEPTSGELYINGKNAMEQNPDKLRQNIGYVIQQVGLFPHMTVYENIATVPRLLEWSEDKIAKRVDELLELVGLDPDENRYKYPRELSGGQKQRVGVARAMAADPPIMLMDEPFGAVDPITRTQLQNEFLKLQRKIKKTICFVTHDIDEAIKMGDRIAIMNNGQLVQYDTPSNILFAPKDKFVEDFVGSDRALKVLNLLRVNKVMRKEVPTVKLEMDSKDVIQRITDSGQKYILVLDNKERLIGYVNKNSIIESNEKTNWAKYIKEYSSTLPMDATLKDALAEMLQNDVAVIPITNDDEFVGTVTLGDIRSYVGESYKNGDESENRLVI